LMASRSSASSKLGRNMRCCINYDPSHFACKRSTTLGLTFTTSASGLCGDAEFRPSPKQGVYSTT
jgi:hypothetical protein